VNEALAENPPDDSGERLFVYMADIGVGPDGDVSGLSPAMQKGMQRAAIRGLTITRDVSESDYQTKIVNGWKYLPVVLGRAGTETEYLIRAAFQSLGGIVANDPEEAVYIVANSDANGDELNSKNRYKIQFNKENLPKANAFWSLTMYDMTNNLTPNPINRYSLGDRSEGLQYDQDGGLSLYISHDPPAGGNESNWLPAPKGKFYLILRAYLPSQEIVEQSWEPPPLEKY